MEATARKRAPHLGPERRRPEVLDAALGLFLEHGYEGASMEAIARAAGVTKPVVYACFASKDELFGALLRREEERILAEITAAFQGTDLDDPRRTLVEGFSGFLRAVAASPQVYGLIFLSEAGGNAAVARRIQRGREAQVEALSALARRWNESGAGGPDPALSGQVLASLAEAGARALLEDPARRDPAELAAVLTEFALGGVATGKSPAA